VVLSLSELVWKPAFVVVSGHVVRHGTVTDVNSISGVQYAARAGIGRWVSTTIDAAFTLNAIFAPGKCGSQSILHSTVTGRPKRTESFLSFITTIAAVSAAEPVPFVVFGFEESRVGIEISVKVTKFIATASVALRPSKVQSIAF
jgi:hypothetical protein